MVFPNEIYFEGDTALVNSLTITFTKYISAFDIDIVSGQILGVTCENFNTYSRPFDYEGSLSSGFSPIIRNSQWKEDSKLPTFITTGTKLVMVNRQTRQSLGMIEFSGFSLNPDAVQLIVQNNLLIVYLDDSNQFFAFQMK